MRLGLIADIHADLRALEGALARPRRARGRPDPLRRATWSATAPARCRRGPAPRPGDPLRPGQPRPLGPGAAPGARACAAGSRPCCATTPGNSSTPCPPSDRRELGRPGAGGPPRLARQRHRVRHAVQADAGVGRALLGPERRPRPDPRPYPHPDDRPRAARDDHQPRLGPGRPGRPDLVQLRRGRDRRTSRCGSSTSGPAARSAATRST